MTVLTKIVNCGNHPDDKIEIHEILNDPAEPGFKTVAVLGQREMMTLPSGDSVRPFVVRTVNHGSGSECRDHDAMAICTEGPGKGLVRADFNPGGDSSVDRIKRLAAALINEVHASGRDQRLVTMAEASVEGAAMWAVKAVTGR